MAHKPIRQGIAKVLTIDFDALPLLLEMAPCKRSQGRFLSELLRAEKARREDRARVRPEVLKALATEDTIHGTVAVSSAADPG